MPAKLDKIRVSDLPGLKTQFSDAMGARWDVTYPAGENTRQVGVAREDGRKFSATVFLRPGLTHLMGPFKKLDEARDAILNLELFRHQDYAPVIGDFEALYLNEADAKKGADQAGALKNPILTGDVAENDLENHGGKETPAP